MPQRMVQCVMLGHELPGLDEPPWPGELGQRIFENVSQQAWDLWADRLRMIINEYRLNLASPEAQQFVERQMEQFFFGEEGKPPAA